MDAKKVTTIIIIVLLLLAIVFLAMRQGPKAAAERDEAGAELFAINVGKADSLLVKIEGKTYLVDTGTVQSWGAVHAALTALDITYLDGVFLTHTDKDHMGGMASLAASDIGVGTWYASQMYTDIKKEGHPALLAAAQRGTAPVWLKAGDRVAVSQSSIFQVLGPITLDEQSENDNSLVMVLLTPHGNMMLAGDMEFAEEKAVMAAKNIPKCAVLKVSHHGRDDSTSPEFARLVSPQVAVISTNSVEEPDSPSPSALAALSQAGAKVVVTQDAKGGVKVTLKDGKASVRLVDFGNLPDMITVVGLTDLDHEEDVLTITNTGRETVSLAGWYVFSVKGEEIFFFPKDAKIAPGVSVRLGSEATPGACDWYFSDKNVWSDKKKDEAVLYDEYGRVVDRMGNGLTEE